MRPIVENHAGQSHFRSYSVWYLNSLFFIKNVPVCFGTGSGALVNYIIMQLLSCGTVPDCHTSCVGPLQISSCSMLNELLKKWKTHSLFFFLSLAAQRLFPCQFVLGTQIPVFSLRCFMSWAIKASGGEREKKKTPTNNTAKQHRSPEDKQETVSNVKIFSSLNFSCHSWSEKAFRLRDCCFVASVP